MYPDRAAYLSASSEKEYYDFYNSQQINRMRLLAENKKYSDEEGLVKVIKKSKAEGLLFRVYDPWRMASNEWARYHVENIIGYHPAKLSAYDKMLPIIQMKSNFIFKMLNVGFDIETNEKIDSNFKRAFFVKKIISNQNDKDARYQLYGSSSDPEDLSYITANQSKINNSLYSQNDKDKIYKINTSNPNEIVIDLSTSGPQFLVISEIFYPQGWTAMINGAETHIFEVNDLIRGVSIESSGDHTIKLCFHPKDLRLGLILSLLSFVSIASLICSEFINRKTSYV